MSEQECLLEHEYDGIKEYDNPTPAWWHVIFWISIFFAIPYAFFFHFSPMGWSVHDAYDSEIAAFYQAKFAKFGQLESDEATIVGLMLNENYMAATAGTYQVKCASCHGKSGEGLVGPNMTDDFYKNIKTIEEIHRVISEGVVAKGMPAWGRQLGPNQLVLLSAYIASLRGAQPLPGAKAAEGEQLPPWPDHPMLSFEDESEDAG